MKTIGILGGMGPRSTSPFLELVLDQCQKQYGAKYDIDYPHIVVYSLPTPFYIDKPINHHELKNSIGEGLKRMESFNVSFIAMPCNTAHMYYEELSRNIDIPILNIIDETIKNIPNNLTITVFATESTLDSGLYQEELLNGGYNYIFQDSWQPKVNEIISLIKSGEETVERKKKWNQLVNMVYSQGIETIILACTDLNVLLKDTCKEYKIKFVDSSECLAEAVVREYVK